MRIFILVFALCSFQLYAKVNKDKRLYIVGSSSVENMLENTASQFDQQTGLSVVKRSVKNGDEVDDVGTEISQLAIMSRPLTAIELRRYPDLIQTKVAYDAIVFFTHKSTPVSNITTNDIVNIYTQVNPKWPDINEPVYPMSKNIEHGLHQAFTELLGLESSRVPSQLGMRFKQKGSIDDYNDASVSSFGRVSQAARKIARKSNSIAYDSLGAYQSFVQTLAMPKTKLLAINNIEPIQSGMANADYPFKRALYIIHNKNSKLGEQKFVDFLLSAKGQEIIKQNYYYPL
ncbi:PstS family phosphate ABC transporter substrate-binding protein [Thalassotalea marina]|uniref:Phosphate-binding protein PstS n=1 Tax=Thalassotalea marina TaxID=1673741 RepID=A0A919BJJ2_9GAMM|nr:substrate-binding domain-containing protein [Thalassotalea marina]GHF95740.1 phosphate-binding protein PstS [Thalassotalea marina]